MTKGLSGRTYEKTGYLYENDFKETVISKLGVANAIAFQSWQGLNENNKNLVTIVDAFWFAKSIKIHVFLAIE